jgi:hypothetical protein
MLRSGAAGHGNNWVARQARESQALKRNTALIVLGIRKLLDVLEGLSDA